MQTFASYFQAVKTDASEYLKYTQNASAATLYPVKPSYVTTSPLYRGSAFTRGYTSTSTTSAATNIYSENSTLPFASDLKRYYESLFQNSYKAMVAACMVFVNFFFPIMNRTICDVSVNHPSAYLRVWDFALRTFNIVDKESPELVNATIKCIEMPTDKRDYLYVLVAAVVSISVLAILLFLIDERKWIANTFMPGQPAQDAQAGQAGQAGPAGPAEQRR